MYSLGSLTAECKQNNLGTVNLKTAIEENKTKIKTNWKNILKHMEESEV